jgi:hypothetical protein
MIVGAIRFEMKRRAMGILSADCSARDWRGPGRISGGGVKAPIGGSGAQVVESGPATSVGATVGAGQPIRPEMLSEAIL